jgi:hypothetical protein
VIWKVAGVTLNQAESLQHSLADHFGGDPAATDSTRVLRLPGFANRKLSGEFIVQGHHESNAVYTLRDFMIPEDSPEIPRHKRKSQEQPRTMSAAHSSQSERDWAYAKRALARGLPPEEIMRDIAEFRARDKYDPADYARRTVAKAQAQLNNSSSPETR